MIVYFESLIVGAKGSFPTNAMYYITRTVSNSAFVYKLKSKTHKHFPDLGIIVVELHELNIKVFKLVLHL